MKMQGTGSEVLELAYNDFATAKQRWNIISEFYGPEFVFFKVSKKLFLEINFFLVFNSFIFIFC